MLRGSVPCTTGFLKFSVNYGFGNSPGPATVHQIKKKGLHAIRAAVPSKLCAGCTMPLKNSLIQHKSKSSMRTF